MQVINVDTFYRGPVIKHIYASRYDNYFAEISDYMISLLRGMAGISTYENDTL